MVENTFARVHFDDLVYTQVNFIKSPETNERGLKFFHRSTYNSEYSGILKRKYSRVSTMIELITLKYDKASICGYLLKRNFHDKYFFN